MEGERVYRMGVVVVVLGSSEVSAQELRKVRASGEEASVPGRSDQRLCSGYMVV